MTTTQRITTTTSLVSYHHRTDLPWGMVPVAPPDSVHDCVQLLLQGGGFTLNEVVEGSPSTWSPSSLQGSGEIAFATGWFRGGFGGRMGSVPSSWLSLGLIERGTAGAHVFGDLAVGLHLRRSTVEFRTDRLTEEGSRRTWDTLYTTESRKGWDPFFRISLGLLPDQAGPWATIQIIPNWTLTKWPKGRTETVTITTTTFLDSTRSVDIKRDRPETEYTLEKATLMSAGLGWRQRFGSQTLTVGGRYSIKELRQLEMIMQFSSEL